MITQMKNSIYLVTKKSTKGVVSTVELKGWEVIPHWQGTQEHTDYTIISVVLVNEYRLNEPLPT
jgi:hypothetical protein